jgi:hypothetical protein
MNGLSGTHVGSNCRRDTPLLTAIRNADEMPADSHGKVQRLDRGELLEWAINEDGLRSAAPMIHRLVSPGSRV